jgi:hypothetical protein
MEIYNIEDIDNLDLKISYHPSDIEDCYLNDALVENILEEINIKKEISMFIRFHENLQRKYVQGKISKSLKEEIIDEISEKYRKNNKEWLHQTEDYNKFYRKINKEKWR